MSITLAELAILSSKKELEQHRKLFPCQYERIIEHDALYRRYYSMEPTLLYGELIKDSLNNTTHFVYFEQLPYTSLWYGAAFKDKQVIYEYIEPLEQLIQTLAYDCHKATEIFTNAVFSFSHSEKFTLINPVSSIDIEEPQYQLEAIKSHYLPFFIGGAVMALILLMIYLLLPVPEPIKQTRTISPTEQFIQNYPKSLSAANTLTNAIHLLMETALLPEPIKSDTVMLDGDTLVASVNKNEISDSIWQQWINIHPNLALLYDDVNNVFLFSLSPNKDWQAFLVKQYYPSLLSTLHTLDVTISNQHTTQTGDITTHSMVLNLNGELSKLLTLSELINSSAITTDALILTRNSMHEFTLTLSLSIHGVTHGN